MFQSYRKLICYDKCKKDYSGSFYIGTIPFLGVQEVCLLHDVVEDTEFTLEDIETLFKSQGLGEYFAACLKKPLELITHNKNDDYETYINKVMGNSISALVKLVDLNDNLDIFGLNKLDDYYCEKLMDYLRYAKQINDKFMFIQDLSYFDLSKFD